ncbi:hypothetical protein LEP3755_43500 [Leptolyngbya sp. NIES-3755]|nr:hypothetical protein LEP3755_43500 [Leptolyngbya sp. NIES-3755]
MPYSIHEIEVTQPLPTLTLAENITGVGLIVRRYDRAIGFLMQPWDQPQIDQDTIASWIATKLSAKIIQEAIRDEWKSPEITNRPSFTQG